MTAVPQTLSARSRIGRVAPFRRPSAAGGVPGTAPGGRSAGRRQPMTAAHPRPAQLWAAARPECRSGAPIAPGRARTAPPAPAVRAARGSVVVSAQQKKKELMMWEALREGLDEEMERGERPLGGRRGLRGLRASGGSGPGGRDRLPASGQSCFKKMDEPGS